MSIPATKTFRMITLQVCVYTQMYKLRTYVHSNIVIYVYIVLMVLQDLHKVPGTCYMAIAYILYYMHAYTRTNLQKGVLYTHPIFQR